jgi:hypothetical protein
VITASRSVVARCPNGKLLGFTEPLRDAFNCSAVAKEPQGLGTRFCVDGVSVIDVSQLSFRLLFTLPCALSQCRSAESVPIELSAVFDNQKTVCQVEIVPYLATIRAQLRIDDVIVANRTFNITKQIGDASFDEFLIEHTMARLPDTALIEVEPAAERVDGYALPRGYTPFAPVSLANWSPETCDKRPTALADVRAQLLDAVTGAAVDKSARRSWSADYPLKSLDASLNRTWTSRTLLDDASLTRGVAIGVNVPLTTSATAAFIPLAHIDESTLLARLRISRYNTPPKVGESTRRSDGEIAIEVFGEVCNFCDSGDYLFQVCFRRSKQAIDGNPLTRVELSVVRDFRSVARFDVAFSKRLNVTMHVEGLPDATAGRERELAAEYSM